MTRLPRPSKPREQLRRRNRPEDWTILPAEGCTLPVPKWPTGEKPSPAEAALWKRLWKLPVAAWWHAQAIEPSVVAMYVTLAIGKPSHASVLALARELGLTPASLQRMRLVVEQPEPKQKPTEDPYRHLRAAQSTRAASRSSTGRTAGKRDEASVALEQALALYERKANLVMVERAQGRREALRALA